MGDPNDAKSVIIRNLTDENRAFLQVLRKQTNRSYNNKALMFAAEEYLRLLEVNTKLQERIKELSTGLDLVSRNLEIIEECESNIVTAKGQTENLIKELNENS